MARIRQQPSAQLDLFEPWDERRLAAVCRELDAETVSTVTPGELALLQAADAVPKRLADAIREAIRAGKDPLGEVFCQLRNPERRRATGATYTPQRIVDAMIAWAAGHGEPSRVVDPGCGSGRFLVAAGRAFPNAELIGIDVDPLAALTARAMLAAAAMAGRSSVRLQDYRELALDRRRGKTLFVGNPPYVRHHQIDPKWKAWLTARAAALGLEASQLAGLHVHFFLTTAIAGMPGDYGALITSSEWLDVNYGKLVRDLFLGPLGGLGITLIEPEAIPFPDTATTAAITYFEICARPQSVRMSRTASTACLNDDSSAKMLARERLVSEQRWTRLTRTTKGAPEGFVELGELCRVHRGTVTGSNKVWIAGEHSRCLPESVLFPSVTRAKEIQAAGPILVDASPLRRLIGLPENLDTLADDERRSVERFLAVAKRMGADSGYIAESRRAWWSVGLREPAPILATYMARKPPAFTRNLADARHINVAHGLYPRQPLDERILAGLVHFLSTCVGIENGRTYAGGLTKFEPREMERLLVPSPDALRNGDTC